MPADIASIADVVKKGRYVHNPRPDRCITRYFKT